MAEIDVTKAHVGLERKGELARSERVAHPGAVDVASERRMEISITGVTGDLHRHRLPSNAP